MARTIDQELARRPKLVVTDRPLHNFLFDTDAHGFYGGLDCFCTPWIDVCVLLHLMRRYRPPRFLEIGTHRGYTTRILADKFPDMQIVTVDPGDQVSPEDRPSNQTAEFLPQEQIGDLVRNRPNVRIVREPFQRIEWRDSRFEMIFVDGNHSLAHVLGDSHLALRLVTQPGVIVWHDYNNVKDVNLALEQLHVEAPVVSLHNTWIAYLDTH